MRGEVVAPIRISGAVPLLTQLLPDPNTPYRISRRFHSIVINCLVILCGHDEPSKLLFVTVTQYSFKSRTKRPLLPAAQ